jgi:hypothetical protein
VPYFVQALRTCGIFADVQYKGYANETFTVTGNSYLDPITDMTMTETWEENEYHYEISCRVAYPAPALPPLTENTETDGESADEGGE